MALAQNLEQSHAVHARQAHIQKDQVPLALRQHGQGGLRIGGHPGLYAAQIQAFGQRPGKSSFIIHQQYAHGPYLRAECARTRRRRGAPDYLCSANRSFSLSTSRAASKSPPSAMETATMAFSSLSR